MGGFQMLWRLGKWSKKLTGFLRGNLRTMRCEKVATGSQWIDARQCLGQVFSLCQALGRNFRSPISSLLLSLLDWSVSWFKKEMEAQRVNAIDVGRLTIKSRHAECDRSS
jgi:hypothetical protein